VRRSRFGGLVLATALIVLLAQLGAGEAGEAVGAPPVCNGRAMYIVAHQDDTLLFQSPSLLQEIASGRCVESIFLTAGDGGREETYWHEREAGAEAAYAEMAGTADEWEASTTTVEGKALQTRTLVGDAAISLVFMRLPDGNLDGEGFPRYGNQSLLRLWRSANPGHGSPSIASITADDGSATYTYGQLVGTLEGLIDAYEPRLIATQNFNEALPEHPPGPDHPDHLVTAYLVRAAQESYLAPHQLIAFKDYDVSASPANVSGTLLGAKQAAFFAYGLHDDETCVDEESCDETSEYGNWLRRQYTTGKVTTGVVAHAGYFQEAVPSTTVALDGSRSSNQSGGSLTYGWTQTKGPTVALSSAAAAKPTFVTPTHPTLLRFRLIVSDGSAHSAPDEVTVRVPSSDPTPVALTGPAQTVGSGAGVELDGSASYDPNSEPLGYAWLQTGGPTVTLTGAATAKPTFTAPSGPATLVFSLTVGNGVQTSAPADVDVTVKGTPPAFTSVAATTFTTAEPGQFMVTASGAPAPTIGRVGGELPAGVSLVDHGDGTATLSGRPLPSTAPVGGSHTYEIALRASSVEGQAAQAFALTVVNPVPAPTSPGPAAPPASGGGGAPVVAAAPKLSRSVVSLRAGRATRKVIRVIDATGARIRCAGRLPVGARCRVLKGGRVAIESRPILRRAGRYRLTIRISGAGGTVTRPLTVKVGSA
jgi:LmbE family N-acetylglucosaminyl deacetylase